MSAVAATAAEPEAVKYDFDSEFQLGLAALVCRDQSFARRSAGLIKPEYFEDGSLATLVAMSNSFYDKYGSCPGQKAVWAQLLQDGKKDGSIRADVLTGIKATLIELFKADMSGAPYALESVTRFAKHQALHDAMIASIGLMNKADFEGIEKHIKGALSVGANSDFVDYDYFAEVDKRKTYREDVLAGKIPRNGVKTGLKKLDALMYHGGWGRQELSVLMGGAKKGKSMGLGYFAAKAALLGYNVLYATLEVSTDIIADRTDACLSSTEMRDLMTASGDVANKVQILADEKTRGQLRIIQFASGSLSPNQLEKVIESYKGKGISFDLIVVDYADIMAPNNYTNDAIENSKQIWLALRAIAFHENAAMLTATQTNREGFKEATAKAEHAAEDFNKVRIADLIMSINRTEEETAAGEARLFMAANRNGAGEFTMFIKQDLSKMQFITGITATS